MSDFVILKGAPIAWLPTVISTGMNVITVRLCNMASGNESPTGVTMTFAAISVTP